MSSGDSEASGSDESDGEEFEDEMESGDDYEFVKPEDDKPTKKPAAEKADEVEEIVDRYQMDPFLVRREATLILLAKKGFNKRTIVFFNEKKQCARALILFTMFGLKAV